VARLKILEYPDPRLKARALPVVDFGPAFQRLADDLVETLHASGGIGLAAPQVAAPLQALVIDVSPDRRAPRLFANPKVLERSAVGIVEESCLSVPGIVENVRRHTRVRAQACGRDGTPFECELEGLEAVCLLHELDHLEGKLFIDRLGFYQRLRVRRRLAGTTRPAVGLSSDNAGIQPAPSQPAEAPR
jgi:peptide deformylase